MSKYAVLILPFFIISIATIGPFIANESTVKSSTQEFNNQIANPEPRNSTKSSLRGELLAQNYPSLRTSQDEKSQKIIKVLVTAYSSSPEETDETPLITASGSYVRPGVVAANFLAFGTKIRLPEIFGDQIFIVEDRLHKNYNDRIDIWFPTKEEALRFGYQISEMEIL
jgi:3D (Asp-Asp-Asp) domain-containing protein